MFNFFFAPSETLAGLFHAQILFARITTWSGNTGAGYLMLLHAGYLAGQELLACIIREQYKPGFSLYWRDENRCCCYCYRGCCCYD